MPIVTVQGLSQGDLTQRDLLVVKRWIQVAVAGIGELGLLRDEVSVFFPIDLLETRGKEVVVWIDGLFKKDERTDEVRARLAWAVGRGLLNLLTEGVNGPIPDLVEVFVKHFNPKQGFWSSTWEEPKD